MKPKLWWRIASGLTLFFAVAHTGGMLNPVSQGLEEEALLRHMRAFHFQIMGTTRTYWEFYFGFGLFLTAALVLVSVLSWKVAALSDTDERLARSLGWPLAAGQIAFAILSWRYFFLAPAVVSSAASIFSLLGVLGRTNAQPRKASSSSG